MDSSNSRKYTDPPLSAYEENQRLYHGNYRGDYPIPCDAYECNRLDMLHKAIRLARRFAGIPGPHKIDPRRHDYRELHAVPFESAFWADSPRTLDLGCGTGQWAIDMARWYPDMLVFGIDIVNIYPDRELSNDFPSNCVFRSGSMNFEKQWDTAKADNWGFIRGGLLCGAVEDWSAFYKNIRYHLMPGHGIFEQVEIDLRPRCDDGSLPPDPDHPVNKWYRLLAEATARTKHARPMEYNLNTKQLLESAGFVDVKDYTVQLPWYTDDDWPPSKNGRMLADLYYACLVGDPREGGARGGRDSGLESMSLATFTRQLGWTQQQWSTFEDEIIDAFKRPNVHVYHVLHIITARNPLRPVEHFLSRQTAG